MPEISVNVETGDRRVGLDLVWDGNGSNQNAQSVNSINLH